MSIYYGTQRIKFSKGRRNLRSWGEKTVKVHRGRVMQKLGLTSVPDLVRLTQTAGVSPADAPHGTKVHYPA